VTPWYHAVSSAKRFGGHPDDYVRIHDWFDETKQYTGDWTHRALRHHSAGVQWAVERFGHTITNSDGKRIPVKMIAEQHIEEDCGFVPTPAAWLNLLKKGPELWMLRVAKKSSELEEGNGP
jgi:hypothetical protein